MKRMRKMEKLIILFLSFVLAVFVFACGNQKQKSGATGGTARVGEKGSIPLATTKPTLSMIIGGIGPVVSSYTYADNLFTKRVVNDTGVQLNIISTTPADYTERINVLLNTGDYPDILMEYMPDMDYYASQGIIIPLDQYDIMSYPNIKAAFEEFPGLDQIVRGSDGKIYGLPYVDQCLHCLHNRGRIWYYMPWIRDNNRKVPTTLDEFRDYLRWVRDTDVNKNGNPNDEVPMYWREGPDWCDDTLNVIAYIAKAHMPFVWSGSYFGLALDDNRKIVEQYRDPRFRQALSYLAGLYKEGLILEDSFTMSRDQGAALYQSTTPRVGILGSSIMQEQTGPQGEGRWLDTFELRPLKGPNGDQWAGLADPYSILRSGFYITDKCKDPELAIALYDYLLGKDVQLDGYLAPKGIGWDDPLPGTTAINGGKPTYRMLIPYMTQPLNSGWEGHNPMIRSTEWFYTGLPAVGATEAQKWMSAGDVSVRDFLLTQPDYVEMMWYLTAKADVPYDLPLELFLPPVTLNDADSTRVGDILATLDTYKLQGMVEFINGTRDIGNDTAWNAYLSDLDRYGSTEYVSILQKYIK
jgi:putative aldouronate transport system substrate-binding protein